MDIGFGAVVRELLSGTRDLRFESFHVQFLSEHRILKRLKIKKRQGMVQFERFCRKVSCICIFIPNDDQKALSQFELK